MQGIIEAIQDTPIPILLIVAGIIFIFLGVVTRVHIIEIQPQQRLNAIFLGIFILFIGIVLNYISPPNLVRISGNDSSGKDIGPVLYKLEKKCIDLCRSTKTPTRCVGVVTSPHDECWLKYEIIPPFSINPDRTIIKLRN